VAVDDELYSEIPGFSYLEPKRHIPHVTDLDGEEARTLGVVLANTTRAIQKETGAELIFLYVFGGRIPHVHFHLAPHTRGDALNTDILSREVPLVPEPELHELASRIRRTLAVP
jgi:diadenosine tetraphosphate (Ap4A) HIT family hydrolase